MHLFDVRFEAAPGCKTGRPGSLLVVADDAVQACEFVTKTGSIVVEVTRRDRPRVRWLARPVAVVDGPAA